MDERIVLETIDTLPFGVGKKLLTAFLQGDDHESITRHRLGELPQFGSLAYSEREVTALIDRLRYNKLVEYVKPDPRKPFRVLALTDLGRSALVSKDSNDLSFKADSIGDDDRMRFAAYGSMLDGLTDEQKTAVTAPEKRIVCIAGAGTGKTTVLTRRIEALVRVRSTPQERILAVTFTRKARDSMLRKLSDLGLEEVRVETFNSFCEGTLRENNRNARIVELRDLLGIVREGIEKLRLAGIVDAFFGERQSKLTAQQRFVSFATDILEIRERFRLEREPLSEEVFVSTPLEALASDLFALVSYLEARLRKDKLRTFTDQLIEVLDDGIMLPRFEHVLVDEYQDVNRAQVELIEKLAPPNLFAVGDPRQAIYGWRGASVECILELARAPDSRVIALTRSFRSPAPIADLSGEVIAPMGLVSLSGTDRASTIQIRSFPHESHEHAYVADMIASLSVPREDVFVLARTRKQLEALSDVLAERSITHTFEDGSGVRLATIHAIKGLEAQAVFVIGAHKASFPCKTPDDPLEEVFSKRYDRESEERRLLYVALTRAQRFLSVSHTSDLTYFFSERATRMVRSEPARAHADDVLAGLRSLRSELSESYGLPAYMVFANRTLEALAREQPVTISELYAIPGLGDAKIARFGERIVAQILRSSSA
jgi:superfamily I DNA/RNA helicase